MSLKLQELRDAMKGKLAEIEAVDTAIDTAVSGDDEAAAVEGKSRLATLNSEFDALDAQAAGAQKHADRMAAQRRIADLADVDGKTAPDAVVTDPAGKDVVPAGAIDHNAVAIAATGVFLDWVEGKSLDGEARKIITPRAPRFDTTDGKKQARNRVVLPDSLWGSIFGGQIAGRAGKVIYSTATPASGTNPSGGQNLVPPDFRSNLQMLAVDVPAVLDRVTILTTKSGSVTWPVLVQADGDEFGGVSFSWIGEGAAKPETEPVFEQRTIQTHEIAGTTKVSERMLSRSVINLEAFLSELFRGALRSELDDVILTGSGTAQPSGIINTANVRTVARQAAGSVGWLDLVNLKHAIRPQHRAGSTFVIEDSVEAAFEGTLDTLGRPIFTPSIANGQYDRMIGYPYQVDVNCPTLGVAGDIVFGNLRAYTLVIEEEITVAKSEHAEFENNLVVFKVFAVVGGQPLLPRAFVILDDAES